MLRKADLQMPQVMLTSLRTVTGARAIGPRETRQTRKRRLHAQRDRDESARSSEPQGSAKRRDDASSPRTTMGALSKDETFMCEKLFTAAY